MASRTIDDPASRAARFGADITRGRDGQPHPRPATAAPCPAWCDYDDVDVDGTVFHRTGGYLLAGTDAAVSAVAYDDKGAGTLDAIEFSLEARGGCQELTAQQVRDLGNALLSFQSRVERGNHPTDDSWPAIEVEPRG